MCPKSMAGMAVCKVSFLCSFSGKNMPLGSGEHRTPASLHDPQDPPLPPDQSHALPEQPQWDLSRQGTGAWILLLTLCSPVGPSLSQVSLHSQLMSGHCSLRLSCQIPLTFYYLQVSPPPKPSHKHCQLCLSVCYPEVHLGQADPHLNQDLTLGTARCSLSKAQAGELLFCFF
jgi:hypothetical protein